jgi:hypothetical protein
MDLEQLKVFREAAKAGGSAPFGQITGKNAAGPRIAQFSLKLVF